MKTKIATMGEWIEVIIIALLIAMLVETFIFGFAMVQGQSMFPTLNTKDRLFVTKFSYLFQKPSIGDVVIFHPPNEKNKKELFIKRVIATEYDRFAIREGHLYINNKKVIENYVSSEDYVERSYQYTEGMVPPNMVFVLGDNRNDSNDSRSFGFVSTNQIKGKVLLKVWPLDEVRTFLHSDIVFDE